MLGLCADYRSRGMWQTYFFRGIFQKCEMYVQQCFWSHCQVFWVYIRYIYMDIIVSYLYRRETAWLLLRFHGTEPFKSVELYREDGLQMALHRWHWGRDYMLTAQVSQRQCSSSQYDSFTEKMILKRLLLVTLVKTLVCTFIVLKNLEKAFVGDTVENTGLHIHCSDLPGDRACRVDGIVLLQRWCWKCHSLVILGKTLHAHCSGLLGDRPCRVCRVLHGWWPWNEKFICDTKEDSAHSLFRSPRRHFYLEGSLKKAVCW